MSDTAQKSRKKGSSRKFRPAYLRSFEFKAKTVFDIGVGNGTEPLYEVFSGRKIVLVDPQRGVQEKLYARRPHTQPFDFHAIALGSNPGTAVLKSFGPVGRTSLSARPGLEPVETYEVPVTTLDALVAANGYSGPFGIKVDTEGHEIEVLSGAANTLRDTEFVIAEVSVRQRFVGGYRFSEMIAFMAANGFELIDILNVQGRVANFLDCVFMPAGHSIFARPGRRKDIT